MIYHRSDGGNKEAVQQCGRGFPECHHEFFFGVMLLFNDVITLQARTAQYMSSCFDVWQALRAQQSYIFAPTTETSGMTTTDLEHQDELEENSMTVYVKTISGKTISIKCDKKQKVDMKTSIPQGITHLVHQGKVLNDKKTMEENNIGAEATIEMSLRLQESEMIDSLESEDEREKKRKLKGKSTRRIDDAMFLRREIIDAIKNRTNRLKLTKDNLQEFRICHCPSLVSLASGVQSVGWRMWRVVPPFLCSSSYLATLIPCALPFFSPVPSLAVLARSALRHTVILSLTS